MPDCVAIAVPVVVSVTVNCELDLVATVTFDLLRLDPVVVDKPVIVTTSPTAKVFDAV